MHICVHSLSRDRAEQQPKPVHQTKEKKNKKRQPVVRSKMKKQIPPEKVHV
jgi:hypothetical protein